MNKTIKSILVLAIGAVAMSFTSCSNDDDNNPVVPTQQEIETKIIGKWKDVSMNGIPSLTNKKAVRTYYSDKTETVSMSTFIEEIGVYSWEYKNPFTWSVAGNVVTNKQVDPNVGFTHFNNIIEISDNQCSYITPKAIGADGTEYILNQHVVAQRVTADYSQDIIGLWEGVEMTGYETYGNAEARILYRADGTYIYYIKDGEIWVPSTNVDNEYNVDGDWLATRWRPEAGKDYNYEWWDIDYIKDGTMKWSALREKEDGTRFTTTFTWKKVEMPTQQEIETKIIGKWKDVSMNGVPSLTNKKAVRTYYSDKTETVSMSTFIEEFGFYSWENKNPFTWSVEGNVVTNKQVDPNVGKTHFNHIVEIGDNQYSYITPKAIGVDGTEYVLNQQVIAQRVTADYSKDIIGLWEGVEMTGYETYGGVEARIEYKADGTYTYYTKVDGAWQPLTDVLDEWNVDGDWLATRWQNQGSGVVNYEWWDIDYIKNGTMKWSALREKEDGTRFTTTFTWKKIVE